MAARLALAWIRRPRTAAPVQPILCLHCNARDSQGALCEVCWHPVCADCEFTWCALHHESDNDEEPDENEDASGEENDNPNARK